MNPECFFSRTNVSGRRGGSVVSASDLSLEGQEFQPWPVHPRYGFCGKINLLSGCVYPPRFINGLPPVREGSRNAGGGRVHLRFTSIPLRNRR